MRGKALGWFKSYLSDRKQKVQYQNILSENTCDIQCGAPQGSILAPLLFLVYINDLPKCLERSEAILFADDTNIFITAKNKEELFRIANTELKNVNNWMLSNKLALNTDKSNYILFHERDRSTPTHLYCLGIGNADIVKVSDTKFLGLLIDEKLSWNKHMLSILSKIRRNLGVIRKISPYLTKSVLFQLFHTMIMSHVKYGIMVWHHGNITMKKKIQASANNFIRLIFHMNQTQSVRPTMKESKLLSNNQLFFKEVCKFVQKLENKTIPSGFINLFSDQLRDSNLSTRSNSNYNLPFSRINLTDQAITYHATKAWHSLPPSIKINPQTNCLYSNEAFAKRITQYALTSVDF